MKYATLPLGLAILMASVVAAAACDHYYFVCKPDLTEVFVLLSDGGKDCNDQQKRRMYWIGDKSFPLASPLFRLTQNLKKGDVLYYRGQRCVGPYLDKVMPQ